MAVKGPIVCAYILMTLAFIVACGGDTELATALPENTPVPAGATPASLPEDTPVPKATEGPASTSVGAPAPTPISTAAPAATSTAEPPKTISPTLWTPPRLTEDEETAFEFINSLAESVKGTSLAFEVDMELGVRLNGQDTTVPVTFDGDFQGGVFGVGIPTYIQGRLTVEMDSRQALSEVIAVHGRIYVWDESGAEWEGIPTSAGWPVFPDPRAFVLDSRQFTGHLTQIAVVGEELVDGANTVVISATSPDVEIFRAPGEYDITYWFGKEDGHLKKVEMLGKLSLPEGTLLAREIKADTADLTLTARFFDYGKPLEVLTPELMHGIFGHKATLADDGRILVTGGFSGVANNNFIVPFPVPHAQIYSFETGLWESVGGIDLANQTRGSGPSIYNGAVKLPDGRILVFGIEVEGEETGSSVAYLLDKENNSWEFFAKGGLPRFDINMLALADGRVLIAGGVDLSNENSSNYHPDVSADVEIFDPATGTWNPATAMPQVGEGQELVVLQDGRVLAIHYSFGNDGERQAQLYDPLTDAWTFTGRMGPISDFPRAIVLKDGRVLLTSYWDNPVSYLFDPAANDWETSAGVMMKHRGNHGLTLLPDGRVLASGGDDFFEGVSPEARKGTTEIFDPATGQWTPGQDLKEIRSNHTATLLPDGRVFLIGGIQLVVEKDEIAPTTTTEFIDP